MLLIQVPRRVQIVEPPQVDAFLTPLVAEGQGGTQPPRARPRSARSIRSDEPAQVRAIVSVMRAVDGDRSFDGAAIDGKPESVAIGAVATAEIRELGRDLCLELDAEARRASVIVGVKLDNAPDAARDVAERELHPQGHAVGRRRCSGRAGSLSNVSTPGGNCTHACLRHS